MVHLLRYVVLVKLCLAAPHAIGGRIRSSQLHLIVWPVDHEAVKPRRERRLVPETADPSKEAQERLLG
jgi:hypothetical protein